jgi:hypothetical protein
VCRCRHCGAIQTVPSHLKKGKANPDAPVKPGRTLFKRTAAKGSTAAPAAEVRTESPELTSSGRLEGFRLQIARFNDLPRKQQGLIIGGGAGAVLLIALVIWLIVR